MPIYEAFQKAPQVYYLIQSFKPLDSYNHYPHFTDKETETEFKASRSHSS